jgi:hypothetical protein
MSHFERASVLLALLVLSLLGAVPVRGQAKKPTGGGGGPRGADPPSICDAIPGNLVQNCGFETGDFTHWTVAGFDTADTFVSSDCDPTIPGVYGPNSGTYSACLGSVGGLTYVSQTITDIPGKPYTLTIWLKSDGQTPNEFQASYNGTVLTDMVNMTAFGYTQFSFPGLIGTGSDTIKFGGQDDPEYLNLDDVSFVEELPGSYVVSYFANAHTAGAPDGTLALVNDGNVSDASTAGDLCAAIYVFDDNENMQECCSCRVTPNGYLSLSINSNLTANNPPNKTLHRGVIKILSSAPSGGACDPTTANAHIHGGIHGWLTHIEKVGTGFDHSTEDLKDSTLGASETGDLAEDCSLIRSHGNGVTGVCSCADAGR